MTRRALWFVLLLMGASPSWAQNGTVMPTPRQVFMDPLTGNPCANCKLYSYQAGTTTPIATYSDVTLSTPNANPITLDAGGSNPAGAVFLAATSYKFKLDRSTGVTVWTQDNITAIQASITGVTNTGDIIFQVDTDNDGANRFLFRNGAGVDVAEINESGDLQIDGTLSAAASYTDIQGTAGETVSAGQCVYLSDGSGSKTSGRWYKCDSANVYSSVSPEVGIATAAITGGSLGTIRLSGAVTGLSSLTTGTIYYIGTSGALTSTAPTLRRVLGQADSTTSLVLTPWPLASPPPNTGLAQGRLTLTSGTPLTSSDVTGASTIYYCPYVGSSIALYDGTATWNVRTFSETSLALSSLVTGQAYDVFAYDNAGVLALETAEWANATVTMTIAAPGVVTWTAHGMATGNAITFTTTGALPTGLTANTQYFITVVDANTFKLSTTLANVAAGTFITTSGTQSGVHTGHQPQARQTALTSQNGVSVKSGATTRRYLGMFVTTATNTTEDSVTKRYLWNFNNRARRPLQRSETTASWPYSTLTWRQMDGVATNQVEVVVGAAEATLHLESTLLINNTNAAAASAAISIGEMSTTAPSTSAMNGAASFPGTWAGYVSAVTSMTIIPTAGMHWYLGLEIGGAATTNFATVAAFIGGTNKIILSGWIEG